MSKDVFLNIDEQPIESISIISDLLAESIRSSAVTAAAEISIDESVT